jgi:hypothetical protein
MQDNNQDEVYNELQDYLNHQQSWCEEHLGEELYHALKEGVEVE